MNSPDEVLRALLRARVETPPPRPPRGRYAGTRGNRTRRILPASVRRSVLERDGWTCQLCGEPIVYRKGGWPILPGHPVVDHRIPVSQGGTDDPSNLQAAHWSCNQAKGNRSG